MFPPLSVTAIKHVDLAHPDSGASLRITDDESRRRERRGCALIIKVGLSGTGTVFRAERAAGVQSHKAELASAVAIAHTSRRSSGENIQSLLGTRYFLKGWSELGKADIVQSAIHSNLGRAENAKFIEHFRYILVASQLLTEHYGQSDIKTIPNLEGSIRPEEYKAVTTSVAGAVVTATTAFALVWLIHWSRDGKLNNFHKGRVAVVITTFILVGTVLYAYARRQWLLYLRQNAVTAGSTLVTNLQAFNSSSVAALTLIQEVELVSRGYRLSQPLPPITRLEEKGQRRRCSRLRKALRTAYAACIPDIEEACVRLRRLIDEDSLEKYLDVYEIGPQDVQEATIGFQSDEFDDTESLKALRMWQYRFSVLRKVFLCSLLSLEADGGRADFGRWKTAVSHMERVATVAGECAEKLNLILQEEEQFIVPQTSHRNSINPERERIRNQVRKLGSLSSGIRGLQAKMQILREESTKSLEESDDFIELGQSLLSQYDSIGADLKSLVQAWESGRSNLALNLERHEKRISQASSSLRSPTSSLGGLTSVDETARGGSPSDALRALEGHSRQGSNMSSPSPPASAESNSDEEIFEAIAIPRQRTTMTREERIAKMQEDRVRQAAARERREAGMSMIRELESVMKHRPKRMSMPVGRVTSL